MALRPIIILPDTRLREISRPIERLDSATGSLIEDMLATMYDAPGIGLAAIQIAEPVRLVTIDVAGKDEPPAPMVFINPDHFNIFVSIYVVLYVVLGGVNNLWGPVIGASVMTLLPEMVRALQTFRPLIFGAVIIALLLVRPNGLLSLRLRTLTAHKERDA